MNYLNVKQASQVMDVTIQAVYQAIRYGSLQATKRLDRLYTTQEWIDAYRENLGSKQLHSTFNGRKRFNEEKGELSMRMAADRLGVPVHIVQWMITQGRIKGFKRGAFWVIPEEQLTRAAQIIEENRKMA